MTRVLAVAGTWVCIIPSVVSSLYNWTVTTCTAMKNTLTTMVRAFYEQNCAMVVGTYMMTDFNMNMIAPGIIDHKEWTPENGRNNALRINGLGAPRAFYTPVLREVKVRIPAMVKTMHWD